MAVLLNHAPEYLSDEALPHKTWTRSELLLVEETGVFADIHCELVDGELIDKMGKKYPHVRSTRETVIALEAVFGPACVLQEAPIDVAPEDIPRNEPEPDVTVLRSSFRNKNRNPQPSEIVLIVEIADTTLRQDLTTKADLYARAGIAEYWVLDLKTRRLHVLRDPVQGSYALRFEMTETESVAPLEHPGQTVAVRALLG